MNNTHEAKQGFLTFIVTLVITTGVFFAFYTVVNKLNSKVDSENKEQASLQTHTDSNVAGTEVVANNSATSGSEANSGSYNSGTTSQEEKPNVFANLVQKGSTGNSETEVLGESKTVAMNSTSGGSAVPSVLAGATTNEATSGATPNTGSEGIVSLILMSGMLVFAGTYFGVKKARVVALRSFEDSITKEL